MKLLYRFFFYEILLNTNIYFKSITLKDNKILIEKKVKLKKNLLFYLLLRNILDLYINYFLFFIFRYVMRYRETFLTVFLETIYGNL